MDTIKIRTTVSSASIFLKTKENLCNKVPIYSLENIWLLQHFLFLKLMRCYLVYNSCSGMKCTETIYILN